MTEDGGALDLRFFIAKNHREKNMADERFLKLTFGKKWIPGYSDDASVRSSPISLFGHYDTLAMKSPKSWNEFRPGRDTDSKITSISDEYTMRLVCPREIDSLINEIDSGKDNAYDYPKFYDFEGCCKDGKREYPYPIVACTLVHLSDNYLSYIRSGKRSCFREYSLDIAKKISEEIVPNIKYAVYYNLGYPDIVIIFYSVGIKNVERCVDRIRNMSCRIDDKNKRVVSSAYTIVGYVNDNDAKFAKQLDVNEEIKSDIDLTFNTPDDFRSQRNKLENDISSEVYMMFGNHDWRCVCNKNNTLGSLIELHKNKLSPYHGAGKDGGYRHVVTRLLCSPDSNNECADSSEQNTYLKKQSDIWEQLDGEVYNAFSQFKELYGKLYETRNLHRRPISAVWEVILLYFKIISTTHCGDVKKIVGRFIVSYLTSLSALVKYFLDHGQTAEYGPIFIEGKDCGDCSFAVALKDALTQFRIAVNPLLFDIWRSDSEYFEGQTTEHPTVGSAMKLVFAYNSALEKWDKAYVECCKSDTDTGFTYLVTSGGRDITENIDIFDRNHDIFKHYCVKNGRIYECEEDTSRISRPIIVFIPESSLYNAEGTLHLLSHEFFHKRGDRLRGSVSVGEQTVNIDCSRPQYFYDTLCDIVAQNCKYIIMRSVLVSYARFVFENMFYKSEWREIYRNENNDIDGFNGLIYHLHNCPKEATDDLTWLINCFIVQSTNEARAEIAEERIKTISEYKKDRGERLNRTFSEAKKKLDMILNDTIVKHFDSDKTKECLERIGKVLKRYGAVVLPKMIAEKHEEYGDNAFHSRYIYFLCYYSLKFALSMNEVRGEAASELKHILIDARPTFSIGTELLCNTEWFANANDVKYCESVWNEISEYFGGDDWRSIVLEYCGMENWVIDFDVTFETVCTWFSECYSDCMALSAIGIYNKNNKRDMLSSFMKYIFIFVFENRDLNTLFCPDDLFAQCRIDASDPIIAFNSVFMRIGIVKDVFWACLNSAILKKNKTAVKLQIEEYYKDVMYGKAEGSKNYAERLYALIVRVLESYERLKSGYTENIVAYLNQCMAISENKTLFDKIKNMSQVNGAIDNVDYVFDNWLDCYLQTPGDNNE